MPWRQLASSAILVVVTLLLRGGISYYLRRGEDGVLSDHRRRILSNVRNAAVFLILIGLIMIWAPALRTLILSLTAVAVAIIVATKELIACLTGAILRSSTGAFRVGDWIEIGGVHGEVLDQSLMSVTIQEIPGDGRSYHFTGRTVVVPNSQFLASSVRNGNFIKRFVYHRFVLHVDPGLDAEKVAEIVLDSLKSSMEPHEEVASRYNAFLEKRTGLDLAPPEPSVLLDILPEGRVRITATVFVPTGLAIEFEQLAVRLALREIQRQRDALKAGEKMPEMLSAPVPEPVAVPDSVQGS